MSRLNCFLAGVKVLDLSQYIPGPMASLFLADMGAEVLKIEPPQGDEMRGLGPHDAEGGPIFYGALNAGKEVRRMDLKDAPTRAEFIEQSRDFDILIEGFRPGVTTRLGVDYATLSRVNPRLDLLLYERLRRAREFDRTGRSRRQFMAASGLLDRNGAPPRFFDPPLSDTCGAAFAALAILGALHDQRRTGRGSHIDLGLADVMMPLQIDADRRFRRQRQCSQIRHDLSQRRRGLLSAIPNARRSPRDARIARAQILARLLRDRGSSGMDRPTRRAAAANRTETGSRGILRLGRPCADPCEFAQVDCCLSAVLDLGDAVASEHTQSRKLVRAHETTGELQALFPAYVDGAPPQSRTAVRTGGEDAPARSAKRIGALEA